MNTHSSVYSVLLDKNIFDKLRTRYIIGLTAIAMSLIISANLVKSNLNQQLHDSRVINVAGRQRMLSQKIVKTVLLLDRLKSKAPREHYRQELRDALALWKESHEGLRHGNDSLGLPKWVSTTIDSMYVPVDGYFKIILSNASDLLNYYASYSDEPTINIDNKIDTILNYEPLFLNGMDKIVFQYDKESKAKVNRLISVEKTLLFISLFILLCELLFIFTPIALYIRKIIAGLVNSETQQKELNRELRHLYESLEQSKLELDEIYYAVDQSIMFARIGLNGNLLFISERFAEYLGTPAPTNVSEFFTRISSSSQSFENNTQLLERVKSGELVKNEINLSHGTGDEIWFLMTMVPIPAKNKSIDQLMIICIDVTERKRAEFLLQQATREKYKRKVAQEKLKSSFILEGQEKERRRIAREIHDGIGQLLTGLKFQLESINGTVPEKEIAKIEKVRNITSDVIREVRRVSFNLAPSGLKDNGLVPTLQALVRDLNGLGKAEIKFENITGFDDKLERNMEINLFRIIQEALNNALKYSQAKNIFISLMHEKKRLMISIEDDGIGFHLKTVLTEKVDKMSGHGIMNMKERAKFIDARLDIDAAPGSGTTIKVDLPIKLRK